MPNSPFGLAYGIGAGLAGVPGAIEQNKQNRIALAMKNLQLEQARRQVADEASTREIMAKPFTPQAPPPVEVPPVQAAIAGSEGEYSGTQANPEFVGPPTPEEMLQKTEARPGKTIAPYMPEPLKKAQELAYRAQQLQQAGHWQTAAQVDQLAQKQHELGIQSIRDHFSRAIKLGDTDKALEAIHGLGFTNVTHLQPTEDGGLLAYKNNDPNPTVMTPAVIAGIAGKEDFNELQKMMVAATRQQQVNNQNIIAAAEHNRKLASDAALAEYRKRKNEIEDTKARNYKDIANKTPAKILTWEYEVKREMDSNPGLSADQAWKKVRQRDAKGGLSVASALQSISREKNQIFKDNGDRIPKQGDEFFNEWNTLVQQERELRSSKTGEGAPAPVAPAKPTTPPPPPGAKIL